jgi:hypothetical protein
MSKLSRLQQHVDDLQAGMERVADAVRAAADDSTSEVKINRAGRHNIVIAGTTGEPGAHKGVASRQTTRIRQRNGETVEETTTTSTSSSEGTAEGR